MHVCTCAYGCMDFFGAYLPGPSGKNNVNPRVTNSCINTRSSIPSIKRFETNDPCLILFFKACKKHERSRHLVVKYMRLGDNVLQVFYAVFIS
jgi:hypothetical protein